MSAGLEISEHVAVIAISYPEDGNLVDLDTARALSDAATEIRQRDEVWVAVLNSASRDFCLGSSSEVVEAALAPESLTGDVRAGQAISEIEKPVICAVQGRTQDQGLEIALACDLRVAESDSTFAMTQVLNGIMPWDGGTQRLPRLIGRSRAIEMLLTGKEVGAGEALELGLINEAVAPGKSLERAMELASLIAKHGPIALRYLKEAVLSGMDGALEHGLRLEADLSFLLQSTQDRTEGVSSFLERRRPIYRGR